MQDAQPARGTARTTASERPTRWLAAGAIAAAMCLAACSGGGDYVSTPASTGSVGGIVVSSTTDLPLGGVTIEAGSQSTQSAADGSYRLDAVAPADAVVLSFTLQGYAKGFTSNPVAAGAQGVANMRLIPVGASQTFAAAAGAAVGIAGSPAQVVIAAGSLVDASTGAPATGSVVAEIAAVDPAADPASMPGDFRAAAAGGSAPQPIESFGALLVQLKDGAGHPLNLAAGQAATIRIPLATRSVAPPATVPLFYFDEATALWVEQGSATLVANVPAPYYEGSVSHFSGWNADQRIDSVPVTGVVKEPDGNPVPGVTVHGQGVDYSGLSFTITGPDGTFTLLIRANGVASVYAQQAGGTSNVLLVGPTPTGAALAAALQLGSGPQAPQILVQPASVSVLPTSGTRFSVQAAGTAPLQYQWRLDGADIPGATASQFILPTVAAADDGDRFSVVVSNSVGSVTSSDAVLGVLTAVEPPVIDSQPQGTTVTVGASANFNVVAHSKGGTLSFQWKINGAPIAGATATSFTTTATTLADDGSVYSVVVSSSNGTQVVSAGADLHVVQLAGPSITQQPQDSTVLVGQSATFSVVASGTPPLTYQWRLNGTPIGGATSASYTTPATQAADSGGLYSVVVGNAVTNTTSRDALLTVTQSTAGIPGYNLVAFAGPTTAGSITYANGAQAVQTGALLALPTGHPQIPPVTVETAAPVGTLAPSSALPLVGAIGGVGRPVMEGLVGADQSGTTFDNVGGLRSRYIVYPKDGRLVQIDQVGATGAPVPRLLSTLTTVEMCGVGGLPDFLPYLGASNIAHPELAWLFIRGPGPDGLCFTDDDVARAVRMDMTETSVAATTSLPLVAVVGLVGDTASVYVAHTGNQVQLIDPQNGSISTAFTTSGTFVNGDRATFGGSPPPPDIWLYVDGSTVYGTDPHTLSPRLQLDTLAAGEALDRDIVSDGSYAYVSISGVSAARILRIAPDASVTTIATLATPVNALIPTPTQLVVSTSAGLSALPKTGGTTTALVTPGASEILGPAAASGEWVFATIFGFGTSGPTVRTVQVLTTDPVRSFTTSQNTAIVGLVGPVSQHLRGDDDNRVYAVLLADNVAGPNDAGASLRAVGGGSTPPATLATFGAFQASPAGFIAPSGQGPFQWGGEGLLSYFTSTSNSDLYYLGLNPSNLTRITSTTGAAAGAAKKKPRASGTREATKCSAVGKCLH